MVAHLTCHSAVPGSNPASLNLQEHVSSLESQQGWHCNCRLASEGRQRHNKSKNTKKKEKKILTQVKNLDMLEARVFF